MRSIFTVCSKQLLWCVCVYIYIYKPTIISFLRINMSTNSGSTSQVFVFKGYKQIPISKFAGAELCILKADKHLLAKWTSKITSEKAMEIFIKLLKMSTNNPLDGKNPLSNIWQVLTMCWACFLALKCSFLAVPQNNSIWKLKSLNQLYRWENWRTERRSDLVEINQLVSKESWPLFPGELLQQL